MLTKGASVELQPERHALLPPGGPNSDELRHNRRLEAVFGDIVSVHIAVKLLQWRRRPISGQLM